MKQRFKAFLLGLSICLLGVSPGNAEIIRIEKMEEIEPHITSDTVVVFDIDHTLMIYDGMMLSRRGWDYLYKKQKELMGHGYTKEQFDYWWSVIQTNTPVTIIEPETPLLIERLQENGILCMACTAREAKPVGIIEDSAKLAVGELLSVGIDFSPALASHGSFALEKPVPHAHWVDPYFTNGILFSAHQLKGPVLNGFFDKVGQVPAKVIFIDDTMRHLVSVEEELTKLGIPVQCFHYVGAERLEKPFEKELVELQIQHLVERNQWLPEHEARALLQEQILLN